MYGDSVYGRKETTLLPRVAWVWVHLGMVGLAGWVYFGNGYKAVTRRLGSERSHGSLSRRVALFACGAILWARMTFTVLYLLKRKFGWGEVLLVTLGSAMYQLGFAFLGAGQRGRLGLPDLAGATLFAVGSTLNTGSELQRKRFKDDPANRDRLYTSGLFGLSRHINYFGDAVWATSWALLARNRWAALIPSLLSLSFVLYQVPLLDGYLRKRYTDQYETWAKTTKGFIPFVY